MKQFLFISAFFISLVATAQQSAFTFSGASSAAGCDSIVAFGAYVGSVPSSNTSEFDLTLSPNQGSGGFSVAVSINWGDGTITTHNGQGSFTSMGQQITFSPAMSHEYNSTGNYNITWSYTSNNFFSTSGTLNASYNYSCNVITNVYASVQLDCNQDGQYESSINSGVPLILTGTNGFSTSGTLQNNMATFTNLPAGLYTASIDPQWLTANYYSVLSSQATFQTSGSGAYTVLFNLTCATPANCQTTIVPGVSQFTGSPMYSASNPTTISNYQWNIYPFDANGNAIGSGQFSTQANAYLPSSAGVSYVIVCLNATFINGCTATLCDTFNLLNCISGLVYCDSDANGLYSNNEPLIANAPVSINTGNGIQVVYSNINGYYSYSYGTNAPIIINLNANWLNTMGYSSSASAPYTLLSQNCDSVNTYNMAVNCGATPTFTNCYGGYIFCDVDNNGIFTSIDDPIAGAPIFIGVSPGAAGATALVFSDSTGYFSYCGTIGTNNVAVASIDPRWIANNNYTGPSVLTLVGVNNTNPVPGYFAMNCGNTCSDLWTTVTPWMGYYQNTTAIIRLNWGNNGPAAPGNYQLTLTYPAGVSPVLNTINNPPASISGNTITWNLASVAPYFYTTDYISFTIPGGLINGAQHYFTSSITPTSVGLTDCNSANNNGNLLQILGNSYDPNDKNVVREGFYVSTSVAEEPSIINASHQDKLEYTIRFQNTGTAPAQNIYILDTLSPNLNLNTFTVLSSSHSMEVQYLGNGILRFDFPNIWLVDSTVSQELSQGYLTYRITEETSCGLGCEIENTAYIYFDWNDAIITNTTYNINDEISGLSDQSSSNLVVYPNPTHGMVNFTTAVDIERVDLYSLDGKKLFETELFSTHGQLNLQDFSTGQYLLILHSSEQTFQRKLQIIK